MWIINCFSLKPLHVVFLQFSIEHNKYVVDMICLVHISAVVSSKLINLTLNLIRTKLAHPVFIVWIYSSSTSSNYTVGKKAVWRQSDLRAVYDVQLNYSWYRVTFLVVNGRDLSSWRSSNYFSIASYSCYALQINLYVTDGSMLKMKGLCILVWILVF